MKSNTKSILSRETIERIVRENFGGDTVVESITELTEGWFNSNYILSFAGNGAGGYKELVLKTGVQGSKYVLTYEQNIMHTELHVYDLLADTIVPTPKIVARDLSKSLVDFDYFFMEKLTGDNWGHLEDKITPENHNTLLAEVAQYTAAFHKIKGSYFGYIRDDESFHYPTWRSAFQGMVNLQVKDGRRDGVKLPYDELLEAFEPVWDLLSEVEEPCLVNFDMWKKNIMLAERKGEYYIDGIIDHERAFYGDPYADFIASNTICGDVEKSDIFKKNYSLISGKPFTYTRNDRLRRCMYQSYLFMLVGVEVYRYDDEDTVQMLENSARGIRSSLAELKELLNS